MPNHPTAENATKFVTRLKKALKKNNINLQQNQCYELMAQMFGASNWHELHVLLKKDKQGEFNSVSLGSFNSNNRKLKTNSQTEMMAMLEDLDRMFDDNDSIFGNTMGQTQFTPMELFNEYIDKDKLWKTRHPQLIKKLNNIVCNYNAKWIINDDRLTLGLADTLIEGMRKVSMADKKVFFIFRFKILAILTYLPCEYTYAFMEMLAKYPGLLPALIAQNNSHDDNQMVFESRIKDLIKADGLDETLPPLHAEWIKNIYRDNTSESPFLRRTPNPPRNDNLKKEIVALIEEINLAIRKLHASEDEYDDYAEE